MAGCQEHHVAEGPPFRGFSCIFLITVTVIRPMRQNKSLTSPNRQCIFAVGGETLDRMKIRGIHLITQKDSACEGERRTMYGFLAFLTQKSDEPSSGVALADAPYQTSLWLEQEMSVCWLCPVWSGVWHGFIHI